MSLYDEGEKLWCDVNCFVAQIFPGGMVFYTACPRCNRKLAPFGADWTCKSCGIINGNPQTRYTLRIRLTDHTGSLWVNAFDTIGEALIGKSANELKFMKESNEIYFRQTLDAGAEFKEIQARLMAKREMFNNEFQLTYQIVKLFGVNWKKSCEEIIKQLT